MTSPSTASKVLIVEDDELVRDALATALREGGFVVALADSSERARYVMQRSRPDIVVLDLTLPDQDGLELLAEIRTSDDIPVIVCSGRDGEDDKIAGLELGADDYVSKPFSPRELVSRCKTVLRRAATPQSAGADHHFGDVTVNLSTREVTKAGEPLALTAKEFDLLQHFLRFPRVAFSRPQLLKAVWRGGAQSNSEATVTEHIRRLRLKLEDDAATPKHLCTVRGTGYRFIP
jgi:DNA-binding response OmpR family regulator